MSGFLVLASHPGQIDANAIEQELMPAIDEFERKGMRLTGGIDGSEAIVRFFANASYDPAQSIAVDDQGHFCAYVGTLLYRGHTEGRATAEILKECLAGYGDCIDEAIGNFCLIVRDLEGIRIVTDRAGLHHVYTDSQISFISNSFLATARFVEKRSLQRQELLEYIHFGTTFGSDTLISEVRLLPAESEVRVSGSVKALITRSTIWSDINAVDRSLTIEEELNQTVDTLDRYYGTLSECYGHRTTAALSGGYDSRLNLALMIRHGIKPTLFVYGQDCDIDVRIAKLVCESEGFGLHQIDRSAAKQLDPEQYWENQEKVFHGLDGLTQYGFACEPDEISHRIARVDGGLVAVNGGGGEIWRDFWKLPNRPLRPIDFVDCHFAGRLEGFRGGQKAARSFECSVAEKIGALVSIGHGRMSLTEVQSLYARLRLRFWQGKNNSIDNHCGFAITPFSEHHFTVPAATIAMRFKRDGWFERQLICRASSRLASYPTSYGYNFAIGPPAFARMRARTVSVLPTWIRALRRRRERQSIRPYYLSSNYIEHRFGARELAVDEYVNITELRNPLAVSRALTIERLIRDEWA
jgi:asparagine synthase (glutamine-hydrolysing)